MYKQNIFNCNFELLEKQKQALINDIAFGEPTDYFKIYSLECGVGKTCAAENALAKMVKETEQNALLVRYSDNNCVESASRINELVGDKVALPFFNEGKTRDERITLQRQFFKYRILVITAQRYLQLARQAGQKKVYIEGRDTLVIDEYINDTCKLIFTLEKHNALKTILMYDWQLYSLYMKIISKIEDTLLLYPRNNSYIQLMLTGEISIGKEINKLNRLIKANIDSGQLKQIIESILVSDSLDIEFINRLSSVNKLCDEIETIKEFYNQPIISNNGVIYTPDSRIKYWLLKKNFILDASAELQPAYYANPRIFKITNKEKVLDHSKWTVTNVIVNSTKSGKQRIENFYDTANQFLEENYDTSNMLVISNKSDVSFFTCVIEENRAYFGNLIGSNEWSSLKNVSVVQTPNLNDIDYLLKYLHNSRDFQKATTYKWTTRKSGKGIRSAHAFSNEEMEKMRVYFLAEQFYQAIKRVNRKMEGETNVILFCNNEAVVNLIIEHLHGCKFQSIDDIDFAYKETKQKQYFARLRDNSYANKFKSLLAEISFEEHRELIYEYNENYVKLKKKSIREFLGINDAGNFKHQVLDNTDVITFCKTRGIETQGQYIQVPKNKKVVFISI